MMRIGVPKVETKKAASVRMFRRGFAPDRRHDERWRASHLAASQSPPVPPVVPGNVIETHESAGDFRES